MAITISGENNNDRILAQDGVIDSISGFNIAGIITASSFTGDLTGDVTGNVTGNINNSTLLLQTGGYERVRIDSSGRVLIGTTTEGRVTADNLTIASNGHTGMTIRSGTSHAGNISFSDGTSGDDENRGLVSYDHSGNFMRFYTNATERLRLDATGSTTIYSGAHDGGLNILPANNNQETRLRIQARASDGTGHSFYFNAKRSANRLDITRADLSPAISVMSTLNVGIQNSGPVSPLQVGGGTSPFTTKATVHIAPASGNASLCLRGGNPTIFFDKTGSPANAKILLDNVPLAIYSGTLDSEGSELLRITSNGVLLFGTTSGNNANKIHARLANGSIANTSNQSVILAENSGNAWITIGSGASSYGGILFADSGSSDIGQVRYNHSTNALEFLTNGGSSSNIRMTITSNGHILLGTNTDYADANSDDVQIYGTGDTGISITSGTSHYGSIYFGDATSGDARNAGIIRYHHSVDAMEFWTNQGEKARINSSGQMGLGTQTPQANAKLHVVGRVGATEFYTTTTSSPQTDFTSSQSTNKAGLLLHRLSETNGDYCGLEFHTHPSSITSYRKGGIYYQANGTGFGRGDIVFANDNAGDSGLVSPTDHKFRIKNDGSLRTFTNSNAVSSFSNYEHGNVDFNHRDGRVLHSNGVGWDGNNHADGSDPMLVLPVENRNGNSDIGDAYGLCLHSESQDDNDYGPIIGWSVRSNSGNYNTTIAAIVAQKKAQAHDSNWSTGDLHFFTGKPAGYQSGYMNNVADMTITQHGYVTMPRQPVFSAVRSSTASAGYIVFNQTSCNVGGHYNTSNGRFTAPVAGNYFFTFYGMSPNNNTSNQRVAFRVNNAYHSSGQYVGGVGYSGYTNGGYTHLTVTSIITLAVNDYVQVDWQYADLHDNHNKFSGFLVG